MRKFLDPNKIFKKIRLRKNMVAADFGSGSGGWTIPLAKKLEDGKVIAIDILEEPLSVLKSRMKLEKISNIDTFLSNLEAQNGSKLSSNSCNLVLMTNFLFEIKNKKMVLEEGKRVLKRGGKMLIVDWSPDSPFGPQKGRVNPRDIKKLAKKISLKIEKEFEASPYHFGLIFEKV